MEPFLGQIIMFAGNFAPRGWAFCDGSLLPISQYSALFSLYGTIYGGDGRTTFALPDLRGRAPMHWGNGPGLANHPQGEKSGSETNTLSIGQLPSHNHEFILPANSTGDQNNPDATNIAGGLGNTFTDAATDGDLGSVASANTGAGEAVNNMQPYLTVNFIVALVGVYPSRT